MNRNSWMFVIFTSVAVTVLSAFAYAEEEVVANANSTSVVEAAPVAPAPAQPESPAKVAQATSESTEKKNDPLVRPTERREKSGERVAAFWFVTTR